MDNTIDVDVDDDIDEEKSIFFQLKDVMDIKVSYIYINDENEVDDIMVDRWLLSSPNKLYRSEIIDILKKYIRQKGKNTNTYTISSILQYNVDLPAFSMNEKENELLCEYIRDMDSLYDDYEVPFLHVIKDIRDIDWSPTLSYLKDLNELIVIFYANKNIGKMTKRTKKVYLHYSKYHRFFSKKNRFGK